MNSTDALRQALMTMIDQAFPRELIREIKDSRDSLETDSLDQTIVGKHWQEIEFTDLVTRSFAVNYLGPQTAAALLPALMTLILDKPDQIEFITDNTIRLLSRTGTFESYTALELLQSSINRVLEEDVFLPELLAPTVDLLDQQINDAYQRMGFCTELQQEYFVRYQTMKSLLTEQQSDVIRFFLMYLTASELPDDIREAARNSLLFW